jgi:muconolactone delta-isomerase
MKVMVSIGFSPQSSQQQSEMAALIPKEQEHIRELREQGTIEGFYLSTDRSHVWIVMQGESQAEVEQMLQSFPLYPYMVLEFMPLV